MGATATANQWEDDGLAPAICRTVEQFARDEIRSEEIDREGRIPPRILTGLAQIGLFGLSLPDTYGGAGLGLDDVCAVISTLARHDRSVATTVGLHAGLGTRGLVVYGSAAQRAAYLPRLASGELIAAFGATEPGAGSDLTAIRTRAIPHGDRLRVDGSKAYVTNGAFAQLFTVVAATPEVGENRRGQSLVLLERTDRGLEVQREERKLGLRGSSTTGLVFDGVEVSRDRIIGQPGQGTQQLAHVLAWGRTVMAAGCLGAARAALELTLAHVASRRQFGRALQEMEVVREQLASLGASVFAMEAILWATGAETDVHALARQSAVAKIFCSEANWKACDLAIQLHGGSGFIEDTGLARLLRDARVTRIFEGANDVLLAHLGGMEVAAPGGRMEGSLDPLATQAEGLASMVGQRLAELRAQLGVKLLGRARLLHQLGQLVVLRDVSLAVARFADSATLPLASRWLRIARERAAPLLLDPDPIDSADRAVGALQERYAR